MARAAAETILRLRVEPGLSVSYGSTLRVVVMVSNTSADRLRVNCRLSLEDHSFMTGGAPVGTRPDIRAKYESQVEVAPKETREIEWSLTPKEYKRTGEYICFCRLVSLEDNTLGEAKERIVVTGLPTNIRLQQPVLTGQLVNGSVAISNTLMEVLSKLRVQVGCSAMTVPAESEASIRPGESWAMPFRFTPKRAGPQTIAVSADSAQIGFWQTTKSFIVGREGPYDVSIESPETARVGATIRLTAQITPNADTQNSIVPVKLVLSAGCKGANDIEQKVNIKEIGVPARAMWDVQVNQEGKMPFRVIAGELGNSTLAGVIVNVTKTGGMQ